MYQIVVWFIIFLHFFSCHAFPFGGLLSVSMAMASFLYKDNLECFMRECCHKSVHFNQSGLRDALVHQLHGQHIATERVFHHISAHMMDNKPQKALALSFHGYTGVGKNLVANLIVKNLLKYGSNSRFFHFYDATIHFQHESKVAEYKEALYKSMRDAVSDCSLSIFVFDEMQHMPSGVLDVLAPMLESRDSFDGYDFRRAIFLFLSNVGGSAINRKLYDHLVEGKPRDSLQYVDFGRVLTRSTFNDVGGLRNSELIRKQSITAMVPFLPLQLEHVRECVRDTAVRRGFPFTEAMADFVMEELEWSPEGSQLFSVSGCKRVYEKVGFYMQQLT